ncbi:MAG TPA: DUF1269 domain-containing protein [Thermomicrobiales bacterium]|nr:DUF1269 domain-containing protein [Thermomicrobiales bacterium]HRA47585.1 DUF1269 domain-containing protein [Thermomicrobiales bacterium]
MSTLIAVVYDSQTTAKNALTELGSLQKQKLISLEDAVIATNENGKIKLDQGVNLTAAGALGGAFWGGLIGLIFLMPLAGMAIGAASGALSGKLSDYGIDDKFIKELGAKVSPGKAALFLLIREATPDKVIAQMKQFGGDILQSNLSEEQEAKLRADLAG